MKLPTSPTQGLPWRSSPDSARRGRDGADGAAGADGADGATGATGAAGADGADGADGQDGAEGPTGPPGPKDSIIATTMGLHRWACMEASTAMLFEYVDAGQTPSAWFMAAVTEDWDFITTGRGRILCFGVRRDLSTWHTSTSPATPDEYTNHLTNWAALNGGARFATTP